MIIVKQVSRKTIAKAFDFNLKGNIYNESNFTL